MQNNRLDLVARAGLLAGLAVILVACHTPAPLAGSTPLEGSPQHVAIGRAGNCTVAIVGDSLSVGISRFGDPARLFSERGCTLTATDALGGRRVAQGAEVVETWQRLDLLPEVLVVMLGTNGCDGPSMRHGVERILKAAGPDRPVVWQNTFRAGCDAAVNAALLEHRALEMATSGTCRVWVLDHHGEVNRQPTLVSDGLHLAPAGYRQRTRDLVELIAPTAAATPCN